ncbi:MAG TPA: hypothetical protein VN660_13785 [Steroidobacteraceae bacterium]|nr:hypothetical protein [Steroidobacteraceae bacterium]
MKLSIAAITLVLAASVCSYALGQKGTDRPVGISASQWIALSDRAGIIISDYQPGDEDKTSQGLIQPLRVQRLPPPGPTTPIMRQRAAEQAAESERLRASEDAARGYINGYFMVKREGRWIRLSVVPPPQVLGALQPPTIAPR